MRLGVISRQFNHQPFTAACPQCGRDADWRAFVVLGGAHVTGETNAGTHTEHCIECDCSPCPCLYHDLLRERGLAA